MVSFYIIFPLHVGYLKKKKIPKIIRTQLCMETRSSFCNDETPISRHTRGKTGFFVENYRAPAAGTLYVCIISGWLRQRRRRVLLLSPLLAECPVDNHPWVRFFFLLIINAGGRRRDTRLMCRPTVVVKAKLYRLGKGLGCLRRTKPRRDVYYYRIVLSKEEFCRKSDKPPEVCDENIILFFAGLQHRLPCCCSLLQYITRDRPWPKTSSTTVLAAYKYNSLALIFFYAHYRFLLFQYDDRRRLRDVRVEPSSISDGINEYFFRERLVGLYGRFSIDKDVDYDNEYQ